MRVRLLFALTLVAVFPVVVNAQATDCSSGPANTPTYMSGTVIGGPMFAATPMYGGPTYSVVERSGPLGFFRWRTVEPTATVMPAPIMTTTGVMPAAAMTTTMPAATSTGIVTGGFVSSPAYSVVERSGPLGFFRWRTVEPTATVMPAPIMTAPTTSNVMPASATTITTGTGTTSDGVITGGYVMPATGTTTVMPATYTTYERMGPFGRRYYTTPMMEGTTYYTAPGSVMPASYVVPAVTPTYYYPQYNTGRYYGFGGFGFWMR
ncbi:MAG TPA: hypothetical protein VKD90_12975 [Gemmataceae bacterium]|nr:hypothetical protein [Gemmataceae bacterium]